jgi:hypothetical protein
MEDAPSDSAIPEILDLDVDAIGLEFTPNGSSLLIRLDRGQAGVRENGRKS